MNKKAKNLDMNNTFFYDVHGLSLENKSTSKDLVKLLKYIQEKHPQILNISNYTLLVACGKNNIRFKMPHHTGKIQLLLHNLFSCNRLPVVARDTYTIMAQLNQATFIWCQ